MKKEFNAFRNAVFFNDVQTAYTTESFRDLFQQYEEKRPVEVEREVVKARVLQITDRDVVLDLGAKSNGIVSCSEFKDLVDFKVGDEVEVYIDAKEDLRGELQVSRKSARLIKAWEALSEAHRTGEILKGFVKRKIKGGLVLDILDIEVFLPGSQINTVQTKNFDEYVGNFVEVVVVKMNENKDNVVVSRKILIEKEQAKHRENIIKGLEKGQIISGTIKNVTNFGIFVNLGGIVGLLHKKDIAYNKKIDDLLQLKDEKGQVVFNVEQTLQVVIKDFDLEKNYVSLSTKMLTWSKLPEDIVEGSRVQGIVREISDYYALIEVLEGVIGLLHISEMSYSSAIKHPKNVLSLNQKLDLQVLDIDREAQELRLGLKQLMSDPWKGDHMQKYLVGGRFKGRVFNLTKNGVYIEFEPGIEGFLHKKYVSWTKKIHDVEELFKEQDEIEVVVTSVDQEHRLLILSLRDLQENPWSSFKKMFTIGSTHKGNIVKKTNGGIIVEVENGLQCFVPSKDLGKKESKKMMVGTSLDFYVVDFVEDEQKLLLSVVSKEHNTSGNATSYKNTEVNNTLGDLEVLKQLKAELAEKDREDRKNRK